MNNECSIVKDLLPLYAENMVSEETGAFIKTHLAGCEDCRAALHGLTAPAPDAPKTEEALPLKTVKKKLTLRRVWIAVCAVLVTAVLGFGAFLFFDSHPMNHATFINWNGSGLYPNDALLAAGEALEKDFETMKGCKLYSYTYAGDEKSEKNLAYINEFGHYDQCVVFESVFRSPVFGGGAWNANSIYTWTWYLGREYGGDWVVVQKGYA